MTAARDAAEHGRLSSLNWHRAMATAATGSAHAATVPAARDHYLALAAWHTTRADGYERAIIGGRSE